MNTYDRAFQWGPGLVAGIGNGLMLGYLMHRSALVPPRLALLGLIGGPLLILSFVLKLCDVDDDGSALAGLFSTAGGRRGRRIRSTSVARGRDSGRTARNRRTTNGNWLTEVAAPDCPDEVPRRAPKSPLRDNLVVLRLGDRVGCYDVHRAADSGLTCWATKSSRFRLEVTTSRSWFRQTASEHGSAVHRSVTSIEERPRVDLDLVVDSPSEQTSEVDRLVELGATRVPWDYSTDGDFVVLADIEGNRFCVVDASYG